MREETKDLVGKYSKNDGNVGGGGGGKTKYISKAMSEVM